MKYFSPQYLGPEEKEELEAIENGEYVEVKDMKKEIANTSFNMPYVHIL